jgi:hypothetical protein
MAHILLFMLIGPLCLTIMAAQTPDLTNPPSGYVDTMPPVLIRLKDSCGSRTAEVTELRNIPDPVRRIPADTDQVETGIAGIEIVDGSFSYNYSLVRITADNFPSKPSFKTFRYRWKVTDSLRDARVEYRVRDFYDNVVFDTITYTAPVFVDTMPPVTVQLSRDSLQWTFEATEQRSDPIPQNWCPTSGLQRESGLIRMHLDRFSFNLELTISPLVVFIPGTPTLAATYTVEVIDPQRRASGVVVTSDQAGNFWLDTLFYDRPTSVSGPPAVQEMFSIAPNPASELCTVTWFRELQLRTFEIVDLQGRVVVSQSVSSNDIEVRVNISHLPRGLYNARLRCDREWVTQHFLVQ